MAVQRGVHAKTVVGESLLLRGIGLRGFGLYAAEALKKGQYVGEYAGEASCPPWCGTLVAGMHANLI